MASNSKAISINDDQDPQISEQTPSNDPSETNCDCVLLPHPTLDADLPDYVLHEVEHFKQRYDWDCGIACVLMLLNPDQRQYFLENFEAICAEEGFGHSTWTVDLCYLLKRFNIDHCMYSTMMGVSEELRGLKYYNSILEKDRSRVQARFSRAAAAGLAIRSGRVSTRALRRHLARRGPAIALVDSGALACDLCKYNKLKVEFRRCFGASYSGHYVVVVGYSGRGGRLLYRDPGRRARLCGASPRALQHARTRPGTDQDVILVHRSYT